MATITNGTWTYIDNGDILTPTTTKQSSSTWSLSPTTGKIFTITPSVSGYLVIYSESNIDTYGYITASSVTTLSSSSRAPSSYIYLNDDSGRELGGTGNNFGFSIPVTAGETFKLWVSSYSTSTATADVKVTYWITTGSKIIAQYLKVDNSTWIKI